MGDFILFQNAIIGLILFSNAKIRANVFLGIVFFLNGFQGFSHQLVVSRATNEIAATLFLNSAPVTFLFGPSIYFYVKTSINPAFRLRRMHFLHLIPALLLLLLLIPYISTSYADKINMVESIRKNPALIFDVKFAIGTSSVFFFARPLHVLIYAFVCLRLIFKYVSRLGKDKTPFQAYILFSWLKILLYSFALIYLLNMANMFYSLYFPDVEILNPISLLAALSIFFLNIQIFINPYILYGFNNVKYYSNDSFIAKLYKQVNATPNLLVDEAWKNELILKVESDDTHLNFTEKGYTISRMAEDVNIPLYHLNYYFKEIAQESFTDFKNKKRIQFAIDLINDGYLANFTVENLSLKCGFSSRANFNSAFLKATGKRLKDFKKSVQSR